MQINRSSISIIICAYTLERWSDLLRAITSVQNQTVPANEIILVIDHNQALFQQAQMEFSRIKVIENQEERGLSGARNSGLSQATGSIIVFIDEDAVASTNWLEQLLSSFESKDVIGTGGDVRPLWTTNIPGWFPEEFTWVVGCSYKGLPEKLAPIRNPIGCNMSFRREALIAVGGFRNGMGRIGKVPVGCEETELSIRLRQAYPTGQILYQPTAVVYHRVPEWRAHWSYFIKRCYAEGLSKAQVAHFVGSQDGLSSERHYTIVTLPQGIVKGIREGIFDKKIYGLLRAGTIISGLAITSLGYLVGAVKQKVTSSSAQKYQSQKNVQSTGTPAPLSGSPQPAADVRDGS